MPFLFRALALAAAAFSLVALAGQAPWPVIVVDGFGRLPFNPAAWEALTGLVGRQAWMNAQPGDRLSGQRPEIVVPGAGDSPAARAPRKTASCAPCWPTAAAC